MSKVNIRLICFNKYTNIEMRQEGEYSADVAFLGNKVNPFIEWKERLVSCPDIMGGAVTFPDSRLTIRHIGGMLERGIAPQEILEDYPYLGLSDLEFARLFVRVYHDTNGTSNYR